MLLFPRGEAMEFLDYYEILGVPPEATQDQIERAFKYLVRMSHPDTFATNPKAQSWANERMKQINQAYAVLRDSHKRADYDLKYASAVHGNQDQGQRQQQEARQQRTEPRVRCPLCEAHGQITCPTCGGRGDWSCPGCGGAHIVTCPICHGTGSLTAADYERFRQEVERARQQAEAEAARQRAEAAERQRTEEIRRARESRRRIAMAGVGVLSLLFVARSCMADSRPPRAFVPTQAPTVVPPTPSSPAPVQPRPNSPSRRTPRPSLRSISSLVPTQVTFRNQTSVPVKVLWIDYNGREVLYRTLAPGEFYVQAAYATHPWRLRNATTGRTLRTMIAGRSPSQVVVGQSKPEPPVASQVPQQPPLQTVPRPPADSPNAQPQAETVTAGSVPAIQGAPVVRFLTDLSPILLFQTDFRAGGVLFAQPYQSAVIHVNRTGFIMRTVYNLQGQPAAS